MYQLRCSYSFSRVPYITYDALDEYAEQIISRTMPDSIPVDVEKFIEFSLGLHMEYQTLSYSRKILGLTAFNEGIIQVYDERTKLPKPLHVHAGTIVIDTSLLNRRNERRLRFTIMHEAAHWLLHQDTFSEDNMLINKEKFDNQCMAAKEGRIDYSRSQLERNDAERIERQADFLASALLMPKPALRKVYREYFIKHNTRPEKLTKNSSSAIELSKYISDVFNVSKRAAMIRLEKLGAIV